MAEETSPGVPTGKFLFKKLPDPSLDKIKVVCRYCSDSTEAQQVQSTIFGQSTSLLANMPALRQDQDRASL